MNEFENKVFLGGTCNDSTWREELIPMLEMGFFNPVVPNWNEEAYKKELLARGQCAYVLYVLTPDMTGVYSVAEVVDDSNKQPEKTLFCVLPEGKDGKAFDEHQMKSMVSVGKMVVQNGGAWFTDLEDTARFLNANQP